jgi:hypothetical protein
MDDLRQQVLRRRLEQVLIACFAACALFVVGVYGATLSTYTTGFLLTLSPTDRYPFPATMFLFALLVCIALVIVGVVGHWRWLFWFLLVAFGVSLLQIPATILHLGVWFLTLSLPGTVLVGWVWLCLRSHSLCG